jgi:hypothetical protein
MLRSFIINHFTKRFSCLAAALLFTAAGFAQAPANDECTGAVSLTVNASCISTSGTTIGATQSATLPDPDCGNGDSGWDDDVWFSFTPAAGQTAVNIDFSGVSGTSDLVAQIYTSDNNTCAGTFTLFDCADDVAGSLPGFSGLAVTAGITYYIRVFSYSSTAGTTANSNFTICVRTPATAPPANDDCSGAVSLTPASGTACATPVSGSTEAATASAETPPNTAPAGTNDDVWYSFTATATSHKIELNNFTGTTGDLAMAVYSGSCGALTLVNDSDPEIMFVNGLTVGQQYYIRVYTYSSDVTDYGGFSICVTTPTPPANDNCGAATSLSVSPTAICTTSISGTTEAATASTETPPNTNPTGTNDDVWYSFAATAANHGITLSNLNGTATDMAMAIYSGSCGALVLVQDSDPETMNVANLTPGQTYYVRVWTYSDQPGDYSSFDICVTTLTPPPNNECAAAIAISGTSGTVSGSNIAASQSQVPAACNSSSAIASSDVWYSVTADFTGDINIEIDQSDLDAVTETFSGTCGNLTQLDCTDGSSLTIAATAGATYYVRVDGWNNQQGTFTIQATGSALPVSMSQLKGALSVTGNAYLTWSTYSETNNAGFEIQRATDGKSFSRIGFAGTIAPDGNSNATLNYSYTDPERLSGSAYYRLLQFDADGKQTYSNMVRLTAKEEHAFTLLASPNPVTHNLKLTTKGHGGANATITVTDLSGRVMMTMPLTTPEMQLDMSAYAPGTYFIKYRDADCAQTLKVTRQ